MKHIVNFDHNIYNRAQKFIGSRERLLIFSKTVSKFSSKFYFVIYAAVGLVLAVNLDSRIFIYIGIPLITLISSLILRKLIKRPRPPLCKKNGFCMPSNHSASSMIIGLACFYVYSSLGLFLVGCSFLTGVSRVFSGVHYPLDIITGWLLAIVIYFAITAYT